MGTSLCDVTVTLKRQGKIVNIFFLNQDTFFTREYMFNTFTKNALGITQPPTLYVLELSRLVPTHLYRHIIQLLSKHKLTLFIPISTIDLCINIVRDLGWCYSGDRTHTHEHVCRVEYTLLDNSLLSPFQKTQKRDNL